MLIAQNNIGYLKKIKGKFSVFFINLKFFFPINLYVQLLGYYTLKAKEFVSMLSNGPARQSHLYF